MNKSQIDNETRYRQLLDSYGADPSRWPSTTDEDFRHWIANSKDGKADLQAAEEVDQLLQQQFTLQKAPSHLMGAIMMDAANLQEKQIGFRALFQLLSPKPLGGFVAAACIGILLGAYSPNILSQNDAASLDEISLSSVTIDWDGESIDG